MVNMMNTKKLKLAFVATLFVLSYGCSSTIEKADIPSSANPTDEVSKLESDLSYGRSNDFDILDRDDFNHSRDRLSEAKKKLRENESRDDVLDELRYARAYYERAKTLSTERRDKIETVLNAREAAWDAGVERFPSLADEWKDTDNEARKLASKDIGDISTDDVKDVQARYSDLRFQAVKMDYLGNAQAIIEDAKDNGAASKAPKTLKQAEIDYAAAENWISANQSNPSQFSSDVDRANQSADRLRDVMAYADKQGSSFNEDSAIQLVMQDERIHHLDRENAQMMDRMDQQHSKLTDAQRQVALQQAIENARKEFKPSEADVYQQGDKLLIRMKGVSFKTGKATLPEKADSLLDKVQMIADDLNAKDLLVQGHTDSTGSKKVNQALSEERAQSVADYLEQKGVDSSKVRAEGYGDSSPLAPNRTKAGRAQNRRIDIVITPASEQL